MDVCKQIAILAAVVFLPPVAAVAQSITWSSPVAIGADSTVLDNGSADWAYAFGASSNTTVNGVTFTGASSLGSVSSNLTFSDTVGDTFDTAGDFGPAGSLSTNYNDILNNGLYWTSGTITVTLTGLSPGQEYQLQFWVSDVRDYTQEENRQETLDDGRGDTTVVDFNATQISGSPGQTVTGEFTATSSTGSFTITPVNENDGDSAPSQINAMDLEAIPEPADFALWCGVAVLGWVISLRLPGFASRRLRTADSRRV